MPGLSSIDTAKAPCEMLPGLACKAQGDDSSFTSRLPLSHFIYREQNFTQAFTLVLKHLAIGLDQLRDAMTILGMMNASI